MLIIDVRPLFFLFLGLRISWPEKRVGRSEKKIQNDDIDLGPIMSSCRKKLHGNKKCVFKETTSLLCTLS